MPLERQPHGFDHVAEAILIGLLAYLPFAYGGVLPLSHLAVVGAAAGMAICLGLRNLLRRSGTFVWSWAYVPVGLFVAYVALQLVPLPIGLVSAIAPSTAEIWREHLGDVPNAAVDYVTLSLYPLATATDLRLLLAGAVIFLVVVNIYRTRVQVNRLLAAISVIGIGVVLLAFIQHITDSSTILWIWDLPKTGSHSGPFVHYGHFSQFVNLSIGGAIALLLLRVTHRHAGRKLRLPDLHRGLAEPYRRFDLVLVVFIVLAIVAIALSRSRNGLLSMLVAAVVVTAVLQWSGFLTGFGWSLGGIVLIAFVVLLVFGFDPVYERMATIGDADADAGYGGRLALLRDTTSAWLDFPVFGTGQGTFEWAFPMFDQSVRPGTAQHAENQYAEFFVETGVVGVLLLVAAGVLVTRATWRAVRGASSTPAAVAFGLGFGIIAVFFHAFTDFGLRIPAVAVLTAVCIGLPVALGSADAKVIGLSRLGSLLIFFVPAGLLIASVPAALTAMEAEHVWRSVKKTHERLAPSFEGTVADFEGLLLRTSKAVELQPGNIEYRYWDAMHTWHLGIAKKTELFEPGNTEAANLRNLARTVQAALLAGVRYAPTHGPTWSTAGDLGVGDLHDPHAGRWIHRGMRLAPHHPTICLVTGRQLLVEGKDEAAAKVFRRAVRMGIDWQLLQSMLIDPERIYRPAVARQVARGNPQWLIWLRRRLEHTLPADDPMLTDIREETRDLMKKMSEKPDAPDWVFAGLAREHRRRGEDEKEVGYLREYVLRVPRSRDRLWLVKALVRLEQYGEARTQVERFLHSNGNHAEANSILLKLRTR